MVTDTLNERSLDTRALVSAASFWGYALQISVIALLVYFAAFPFVRSSFYTRHTRSQWGPRLDFAFKTDHQNADVLIFGDSSAFIGIDPRLVNARLGLKSVVLPATYGSLPITGDLALRHYLQTNTPPRLLVIYLPSWNLDYLHQENIHLFEGEEMLFRHGSFRDVAGFVFHHPKEAFLFPFRLYNTFVSKGLRSSKTPQENETAVAQALGHFSDDEPFPSLDESCTFPDQLFRQTQTKSVEDLITRYGRGVNVMVYLAPIPHCRNAESFPTAKAPSLSAARPAEMLPTAFLADKAYAHIRPPFVPESTMIFADALRQALASSTTGKQPVNQAGSRSPEILGSQNK